LLIITRLPFRNPKDPLQEARREAFEEANRDYFREASIPEAILRFRQGFGRLIRTQTDQGVVLTLDDRLQTKHYGQDFLDSLPAGLEAVTASPEMAGEFVRLGLS
ncbi:hypothetical protein IIA16_03970, partial [bacterium]|nr:hypothetical protein [bacterium]